MFHNAEINFWNGPMVTRYTGPMVTRHTGEQSQLPVVEISWEKNSKKKPCVHNTFCFLDNSIRHIGPMVTMGHQVHRWAISASSGRNELGKKF